MKKKISRFLLIAVIASFLSPAVLLADTGAQNGLAEWQALSPEEKQAYRDRFKNWEHSGHITLLRGERSRLADFATEAL